jgi:hypothetical protein
MFAVREVVMVVIVTYGANHLHTTTFVQPPNWSGLSKKDF